MKKIFSLICAAVLISMPVLAIAHEADCMGDDGVWHVVGHDPSNR